jgi:hypothetical protein
MSARFSTAEAALVDAVRGETERGPWLWRIALSAAQGAADVPLVPQEPERSRNPAKGACPHRVPPGAWCKRCDRLI